MYTLPFDTSFYETLLVPLIGYPSKPIYNENIIGYMAPQSFGFEQAGLQSVLLRFAVYNGNGFYLRKDNYLEKMPLYCATNFIYYNKDWWLQNQIMKTSDGYTEYNNELRAGKLEQYLLKCLLFTCLTNKVHICSLNLPNEHEGSKIYRNELCLDTTHGETLASKDLKNLNMNEKEKELFDLFKQILEQAKKTKNYDDSLTYGVYQISFELNTNYKKKQNNRKKYIIVYDYPELNGNLKTLREKLKSYYNEEIAPILIKFQFLK